MIDQMTFQAIILFATLICCIVSLVTVGRCYDIISIFAMVFAMIFCGCFVVEWMVQPEINEEHTFCELYTFDGGFYIKNGDDKYNVIDLDNEDINIVVSSNGSYRVEYIERTYNKYGVVGWSNKYISNIYIPKGKMNLVTN